jgi:hypothetical protein
MRFRDSGIDVLAGDGRYPRLRMRPLRGGHSSAAVVLAAAGAPDHELV